jgi:hypothetical protein
MDTKLIEKTLNVKIIQISADGSGMVFGLGDDQRIYVWHHSLEHRGRWVLHINEPKTKT